MNRPRPAPHPVNPARPRPLPAPRPQPPTSPRPGRFTYLMNHPVGRPALACVASGLLLMLGLYGLAGWVWLAFAVTYLPPDIRDLIARQGRFSYMRGRR